MPDESELPASHGLPVDTYREAAKHLRRPFEAAAVKFRILDGRDIGDKARTRCAAYIDARLVSERLNLVCPHLWTHRFEPVQGGMMCHLTVEGLTRSDVGHSVDQRTDMGLKALYSDALKRAAVHFGVGVSLYAIPGLTVYAKDGHVKVVAREGKPPAYYLQPKGELELRNRYKRWLKEFGEGAFGRPLEHGDMEREPEPETEPAPPPGVDPTTGEVKAPEPKSDIPNPDIWMEETSQLLTQLKMKGGEIRSGLESIGVTVPANISAWSRILGDLDEQKRAMFRSWLLAQANTGMPIA